MFDHHQAAPCPERLRAIPALACCSPRVRPTAGRRHRTTSFSRFRYGRAGAILPANR